MAENARGEKTPRKVAALATEEDQFDLRAMALLGVFGSADARRALVRMPSGGIQNVTRGDRLRGQTVLAIDVDRLALDGPGGTRMLRLPDRQAS